MYSIHLKTIRSGGDNPVGSKHLISRLSLLISALIITPFILAGQPAWGPESVFAFAENLEESGQYFRAITEYHRLIFFWPDHPLATESQYCIGRSYLQGNDNEHAISVFQEVLAESTDTRQQIRIRYGLARAYYNSSNWKLADNFLECLETNHVFGTSIAIPYSRLWCRLRPGNIQEASDFWNRISRDFSGEIRYPASKITEALKEISGQHFKNPRAAGVLSAAIPGLGQTYAGRWRDGIVAFLVNGLFIGAMSAAIDRGHNETAAVLGFFELGFYTANIYNAANDAHKVNRIQHAENLRLIENRFGPAFLTYEPPFGP